MLQSLFEEYQYFPRYPERELKITAVLFGKGAKCLSCLLSGSCYLSRVVVFFWEKSVSGFLIFGLLERARNGP